MREAQVGVLDDRDALDDGGPLVLTTESREASFARLFVLLFFNAFSVGLTAAVCHGPRPPDFGVIGLAAALDVVMLGNSLLLLGHGSWGTWTIDLDGVAFRPIRGESRRLAWSEVERVTWWPTFARFRGGGTTVDVPWGLLPKGHLAPARERVAKMLAGEFDLGRVPGDSSEAMTTRLSAARIAVAFALLAAWAAIAVVLAARFRGPREGWVVVAWLLAPLASTFAYGFLMIGRHHRACKRAHPAWPWRLRRSKPGPIEW